MDEFLETVAGSHDTRSQYFVSFATIFYSYRFSYQYNTMTHKPNIIRRYYMISSNTPYLLSLKHPSTSHNSHLGLWVRLFEIGRQPGD